MSASEAVDVGTTAWVFTVTDLKQYVFCPRVLYYTRCLPDVRPVTVKMAAGARAGEDAEARERRRQLGTYGFASGERHFRVPLRSSGLGISALIDMIIVRPDGLPLAIPVDYKLSATPGEHFKVQLACYGLLVEEEIELPAPYGFLYLIPQRRAERVALTPALKGRVLGALREMRAIVNEEIMPEAPASAAKCVNCEFRRFCNDIF